jgi:hypothetical protein
MRVPRIAVAYVRVDHNAVHDFMIPAQLAPGNLSITAQRLTLVKMSGIGGIAILSTAAPSCRM